MTILKKSRKVKVVQAKGEIDGLVLSDMYPPRLPSTDPLALHLTRERAQGPV